MQKVAELYNLSSFDKVTVTKVSKDRESAVMSKVSADFITVTIKDQFISRGEMFHVQKFLQGKWMYEGQRVITPFVSVIIVAPSLFYFGKISMPT